MNRDLTIPASTAVVVLILLCGVALAATGGILTTGSRILLYLLANLVLAFDAIDLIVRLWLTRLNGVLGSQGPSTDLHLEEISNTERAMSLQPFAIVASVYNETDELDRFLNTLAPFKDCVWLIDDASSDGSLAYLRRGGWNCLSGVSNRNKPGALRHLLKTLPSDIQTVVVLDPDVRWVASPALQRSTLEQVISDLQRSGAAALTPRVVVNRGNWLQECQALEYELACGLGRRSLRDLCCNSGVSAYRRSALEQALSRHSLSIYAEDLENSLLLLAAGERIYYDDRLVVTTLGKPTWRSHFSQRVGWAFGCGKLFLERLPLFLSIARRDPLATYQYILYLLVNGIVLLPLKLVATCVLLMSFCRALDEVLLTNCIPGRPWDEPLLFALWYGKSTLVLLVALLVAVPRGESARHLATLPFYGVYSLLQCIPTTVGYLNVLTWKFLGRRLYEDHYARTLEPPEQI
jgi:hypothetical protein